MNRGKFIQQVIHSPTLEYVKPHLEAAANQMIAEGGGRVSRKDVPKAVSWAVVIADQVKAAHPSDHILAAPTAQELLAVGSPRKLLINCINFAKLAARRFPMAGLTVTVSLDLGNFACVAEAYC